MIKISTDAVTITPRKEFLPCYMSGNPLRVEKTSKIHDELYCTVLIIKINEKDTLIWATFDLIGLDRELASSIRTAISEKYHVPFNHITLAASYTHYGPEVGETNVFGVEHSVVIPGYRQYLFERCLLAVDHCYEKGFVQVDPFVQTLMIDGLYGNRSNKNKPSDKEVFILKFRDENSNLLGACVNLSCHPTVGDPLSMEISGDLFGYIDQRLTEEWGIRPLMMQGSAGDMSNRQYRQAANFREVERIGDGIIGQIKEKASTEKMISLDKCIVESYSYLDEYVRSSEDQKKMEDEICEDEEKLKNEKDFDQQKLLKSGLAFMKLRAQETEIINEFEGSVIRLGDLEICQIPAELFSTLGLKIKAAGKEKYTIIWGYTNDSVGYLVEEEEYDQCYEGRSTSFRRGEPEKITKSFIEILNY